MEQPFTCVHCPWFIGEDKDEFDNHQVLHHNNLRNVCQVCKNRFNTHAQRKSHIAEMHGGSYFCFNADHTGVVTFTTEDGLVKHNKSIHRPLKETCTKCFNVFYTRAEVTTHPCWRR